jgi:hypothetical protein
MLDPDRESSGFHRSIVVRPGLSAPEVRGGATGASGAGEPVVETPPSLAALGVTMDAPSLGGPPVARTRTVFAIPFDQPEEDTLPDELRVSVRWDPLDVSSALPGNPDAADPGSPARPSASAAPDASPAASTAGGLPQTAPAASPTPSPTVSARPPAGPELIVPEELGRVVRPVKARVGASAIAVRIRVPSQPGLYRLVATLHEADGVAYDAATQALVRPLIVWVSGDVSAHYAVAPSTSVARGSELVLPVGVTNLGREAWRRPEVNRLRPRASQERARPATLTVRWIGLGQASGDGGPAALVALPAVVPSGRTASVEAQITAPDIAGDYLLLLDVILPGNRSLAAEGVPPALVRVTVY